MQQTLKDWGSVRHHVAEVSWYTLLYAEVVLGKCVIWLSCWWKGWLHVAQPCKLSALGEVNWSDTGVTSLNGSRWEWRNVTTLKSDQVSFSSLWNEEWPWCSKKQVATYWSGETYFSNKTIDSISVWLGEGKGYCQLMGMLSWKCNCDMTCDSREGNGKDFEVLSVPGWRLP